MRLVFLSWQGRSRHRAGNVAVQMLATGAAASLAEARAIIERSVTTTVFTPRDVDAWDQHAARFQQYCGLLYA